MNPDEVIRDQQSLLLCQALHNAQATTLDLREAYAFAISAEDQYAALFLNQLIAQSSDLERKIAQAEEASRP